MNQQPLQAIDSSVRHTDEKSYGSILKSTSIIGGSKSVEYLVTFLRIKLIAVFLGPSGVGMIGAYTATITLIRSVTGLGIGSSGVRQIARANGAGNTEELAESLLVLRRASWVTGIVGWLVCIIFASALSAWSFASLNHAWLIAVLGVSCLLGAMTAAESAIIQGTRRIADLARMSVLSSVVGSLVSIVLIYLWRERGIVPALILTSAVQLVWACVYSWRIDLPRIAQLSWKKTVLQVKGLTGIGIAMMWGGLLTACADLTIRGLVVRSFGLDGSGMYQAAWAISGMFAGIVLGAMGTDLFPQLSAVAHDHRLMNRIMNDQIEIGVLIALPGLIATVFFGPVVINVLYSSAFKPAAILLPWFVLGVYCRVVSFPLGYSFLAQGASRWYFYTQTQYFVIQLCAVILLLRYLGLVGVGIGFFVAYIPATVANLFIAHYLTGFRWSQVVLKVVVSSSLAIVASFLIAQNLPSQWTICLGAVITLLSSIVCLQGICGRVGREHRVSRLVLALPCGNLLLPKSLFGAIESK